MEEAERTAGAEPLMDVIPFTLKTFGVVTTGNEAYNKRIEDTFTPVWVDKMKEYGAWMIAHEVSDDDNTHIEAAIKKVADSGADLILCTGGMSVDPDDRTPLAIRNTGSKIVSYGAPVLPGAMFLMGYLPDGRVLFDSKSLQSELSIVSEKIERQAVLVTHSEKEVRRMYSKIYVMNEGRIIREGGNRRGI